MATVHNPQLAGQKTHSRFGELAFDAKGNCEVDDDLGRKIQECAFKGWQVFGLPPEAGEADDIDSEELDEEDIGEVKAPSSKSAKLPPKKKVKS